MELNYNDIFRRLNTVTGLPLKFYRGKWIGSCYIDGSPHSRPDKTVAYLKNDNIRIIEQGGVNYDLIDWFINIKGSKGVTAAKMDIMGVEYTAPVLSEKTIVSVPDLKYVDPYSVRFTNDGCNLYKFLIKHFPKSRVDNVFKRYCISSIRTYDGDMGTVFWYINEHRKVCHDKVILYSQQGKRNKSYGGSRRFKVSDGYRGRCYFGSHLLRTWNGKVALVESEKTALIMALVDDKRLWLATGGANMLSSVDPSWVIYRDVDPAGLLWEERFPTQCASWWNWYDNVEEGMDIADIVLRKVVSDVVI